MVKALILDMDGVVRHLDMEVAERASQSIGFGYEELMDLCWDNEFGQELLCGRATREEWWDHVQRLDSRLEGVSQDVIWSEVFASDYIDTRVIEFVMSVRHSLVTSILSNCNIEGKVKIHEILGDENPFDYILTSADFGVRKPHPEIYYGMLETIGMTAEDCIFFDDRQGNVEGAKDVGIQAYLFEGVEQLRKLVVPT
jgi:putative hydrolase of the HAD superfamily